MMELDQRALRHILGKRRHPLAVKVALKISAMSLTSVQILYLLLSGR